MERLFFLVKPLPPRLLFSKAIKSKLQQLIQAIPDSLACYLHLFRSEGLKNFELQHLVNPAALTLLISEVRALYPRSSEAKLILVY